MKNLKDSMNCKICKARTNLLFDRQFKVNYHQCLNCGFIFLDPVHIISEKEELEEYQLHENSIENEGYVRHFERFIAKAITPYKVQVCQVLDFGCGPEPVLAHILTKQGYSVDVYDPFFFPAKLYADKKYDVITTTEVFEHLKDPVEVLRKIHKYLKKGGLLAIMTLFHPRDDEKFQNWSYRREKSHIAFYTPETMKVLAEMLDMKVLLLESRNIAVLQK